ncbi:MAG: glutathione S-transferase [Gammaproteobacteria bacterium]|nr:glutathione S-transferase [Gammaproteobacteria bacterium]
MDKFTLVIGNKNYSSWSLRPWLLMKQFGISFEEIRIPLYQAETKAAIQKYSPSGLVPALIHGDITVWDSLAICEYLQDLYPSLVMWPRERAARAIARSAAAEMHSGFAAVRTHMPMNCKKSFPGKGLNAETEPQVARITQLWRECRAKYGKGGAMLFGDFSIADAMYAPVAIRFTTYQVKLDAVCQDYVSSLLALPVMQEWFAAARAETEVLSAFEPYTQ